MWKAALQGSRVSHPSFPVSKTFCQLLLTVYLYPKPQPLFSRNPSLFPFSLSGSHFFHLFKMEWGMQWRKSTTLVKMGRWRLWRHFCKRVVKKYTRDVSQKAVLTRSEKISKRSGVVGLGWKGSRELFVWWDGRSWKHSKHL